MSRKVPKGIEKLNLLYRNTSDIILSHTKLLPCRHSTSPWWRENLKPHRTPFLLILRFKVYTQIHTIKGILARDVKVTPALYHFRVCSLTSLTLCVFMFLHIFFLCLFVFLRVSIHRSKVDGSFWLACYLQIKISRIEMDVETHKWPSLELRQNYGTLKIPGINLYIPRYQIYKTLSKRCWVALLYRKKWSLQHP